LSPSMSAIAEFAVLRDDVSWQLHFCGRGGNNRTLSPVASLFLKMLDSAGSLLENGAACVFARVCVKAVLRNTRMLKAVPDVKTAAVPHQQLHLPVLCQPWKEQPCQGNAIVTKLICAPEEFSRETSNARFTSCCLNLFFVLCSLQVPRYDFKTTPSPPQGTGQHGSK